MHSIPGTATKIKIRGTSTLLSNQDPLWVTEGIIQENQPELIDYSLTTYDSQNNTL